MDVDIFVLFLTKIFVPWIQCLVDFSVHYSVLNVGGDCVHVCVRVCVCLTELTGKWIILANFKLSEGKFHFWILNYPQNAPFYPALYWGQLCSTHGFLKLVNLSNTIFQKVAMVSQTYSLFRHLPADFLINVSIPTVLLLSFPCQTTNPALV